MLSRRKEGKRRCSYRATMAHPGANISTGQRQLDITQRESTNPIISKGACNSHTRLQGRQCRRSIPSGSLVQPTLVPQDIGPPPQMNAILHPWQGGPTLAHVFARLIGVAGLA
jgi:hypothetical protein